ncbi:hypothetical protein ACIHCQ_41330 [Streptomyces sp. NPDC052236]|uniref:hypothetical protein n=1 Tax=Streptomyces sp. NPDC052236 TaxID=3365686 RepID=UPI0037D483ED
MSVVQARGRGAFGGFQVLLDLNEALLGIDEGLDLLCLGGDLLERVGLLGADDEAAVLDLEGLRDPLGLVALGLELLLERLEATVVRHGALS